jgi:hypothetical protein
MEELIQQQVMEDVLAQDIFANDKVYFTTSTDVSNSSLDGTIRSFRLRIIMLWKRKFGTFERGREGSGFSSR